VNERIPDRIVDDADEVELVDMAPHALRQRIRHGNVYPPERAERALSEFFREGNLTALRELALRKVSTEVEKDLETYMRNHDIQAAWPAGERVMVAVSADPAAKHLIRRGWRMANLRQADLVVAFVETPSWARATPEEKRLLEEILRFAEDLGAEVVRVAASDVARALHQLAREMNAGSLVVGNPHGGWLAELLRRSTVHQLLRIVNDVDIHVVSESRRKKQSRPQD
jgi:two-component system sensor histidine kinase KdpD